MPPRESISPVSRQDSPAPTPAAKPTLVHELGLRDGIVIVVGTVIGSGIFVVPMSIAGELSSFAAVLMVWVAGGLLSLAGALALGELGAAFPGTGGLYVYLRHAYGKLVAFLYGWCLLAVIHSGSIATLAVAFRIYLGRILPLSDFEQKLAGVAVVLILTGVNCFGVRSGKTAQNLFTAAKLGGLAAVIGILYWWGHAGLLRSSFVPQPPFPHAGIRFGIALVAVLWAYEGWHVVSFTAGEFKNAQHDLPRGLLYGTLLVAAVYLLVNIAYYSVLTPAQISRTQWVAATAVTAVRGQMAGSLISVLILVCIAGALNGMILTGPRVYYAMAEEGLFFGIFGKLNARYRVPTLAIVIQGAWAAAMTLLGSFQELFTSVIFTAWIFYGLAVAGVIVLRIRRPEIRRPFRAPGYPWLPALFSLAALGVALSAIISSPLHALIGIGLMVAGWLVFALFFSPTAPENPGA